MNKTLKWTLYGFVTSSLMALLIYIMAIYMDNEIGIIFIVFFNLPFGALAYLTPFDEVVIFLGSLIFNWSVMGALYGNFISGRSTRRKVIFFMAYLLIVLSMISISFINSGREYMEMMEGNSSQPQTIEQ